jgi:trimeric autotransporter adhesin
MNKVYKSVWNESVGAWVAVSELSAARGKRSGRIAQAVVASAVTLGAVGNALATTTSDIAASAGATGLLAGDDALTSNSDESLPGARINSLSSSVTSTDLIAGTNLKSVSSLLGVTGAGAEMYLSVNAAASSSDGASAIGVGSLAIGGNAVADSTGGMHAALAIGSDSRAVTQSTVVGPGATATASNTVVLGTLSIGDRAGTVSVSNATNKRQIVNVAAGTQATDVVNVAQLTPVVNALGGKAALNADGSITSPTYSLKGSTYNNVGDALTALADSSSKYFHANSQLVDSSATGVDSVAIGGGASASGFGNTAIGRNAKSIGPNNSIAIGDTVVSTSDDAVSMGSQITNDAKSSVVLGSNGVTLDKTSTQSVLLAPDTGAVTSSANSFSFNPYGGTGTSDSNDSVNLSGTAAGAAGGVTIGSKSSVTAANAVAMGASAVASATDAIAIGHGAKASFANSVALGATSVTDRADTVADRDNTVSVGAAGSERQVTNVAAGTAATDAANVGQLNAVSNSVSSLGASAIKYDNNADGTPDYANATLGNGNTGTALHNVAAGTSAMDAVNLSQLNDMVGQVTNLANGAYNPLFTADGNRDTEVATSSGTHSVASGANALASGVNAVASGATSVASGANSVAVGSNTSATANNAVAVGAKASATASNAVALGAGSVADRANSVSVGTTSAGGQRQITNVAAGTDGTDAVNVSQMQQSVNTGVKSAKGYTDALRSDMNSGLSLANNHINSVGAMSSAMAMMAGSAAAIADKDNRFAAGTGVYRDKAAIAIGLQKRFGTNMVLTVGGSTTGEETTGGAGFAFEF